MTRLSDILNGDSDDPLRDLWNSTEAASEYTPLPDGEYEAHLIKGELMSSHSKGTPGYKLTFRLLDESHKGRQLWHTYWLTPEALPWTKRELAKIGLTTREQLDLPIPPGMRCRLKVALRRADDGKEYNHIAHFDVVGFDEPPKDPFAPTDPPAEGGGND